MTCQTNSIWRAYPILSWRAYPILSLRAEGVATSPHQIATAAELPRKDSVRCGDCFGASAHRNDSRVSAHYKDSRGGRVSLIMWTSTPGCKRNSYFALPIPKKVSIILIISDLPKGFFITVNEPCSRALAIMSLSG